MGFIAAERPQWGSYSLGPLGEVPKPYLGSDVVAAYINNVTAYIGMVRCEPLVCLTQCALPDTSSS